MQFLSDDSQLWTFVCTNVEGPPAPPAVGLFGAPAPTSSLFGAACAAPASAAPISSPFGAAPAAPIHISSGNFNPPLFYRLPMPSFLAALFSNRGAHFPCIALWRCARPPIQSLSLKFRRGRPYFNPIEARLEFASFSDDALLAPMQISS